jgi:hypothetical protein
MTEISLSCETFLRISGIIDDLPSDMHPSWSTLRFQDGCIIATDKSFMAIENFSSVQHAPFHIIPDPALLAQCETESKFNSRMTIVVNEMLKFAVIKTSLGFQTTANVFYTGEIDPAWEKWKSLVMQCKTPAEKVNGAMFWALHGISRLAASSPSGLIVFEEMIDTNRPTLIRDVKDYHWLGVFHPTSMQDHYSPATLPSWIHD